MSFFLGISPLSVSPQAVLFFFLPLLLGTLATVLGLQATSPPAGKSRFTGGEGLAKCEGAGPDPLTSGPWDKSWLLTLSLSVSYRVLPPEIAKQQDTHLPFFRGHWLSSKIWDRMSHFYVKTTPAGFCIGMVNSHEFFILNHKCSRNILAWVGRDMPGTCPCHSPQLLNVGM